MDTLTVLLPILFGFLAGSIPFANLFARVLRRVDLREVGSGTVSGTGLYRVAGVGPLVVAGILEVAKGAVGPLLAGAPHSTRPGVVALVAAAAVAGHNWSPWLRGAGGRGVSPALGALAVAAWPGALLLLGALGVGRLLRHTGLATLVAIVALPGVLAATHGTAGAQLGAGVVVPMLAKRLAGNSPAAPPRWRTLRNRLLYDHD